MPELPKLDLPRILHVTNDSRPKRADMTVVLLHGIGGSSGIWRKIADKAPDNVRVITMDLLGFGDSPKPKGASYNVRIQARSVAATLLKLRIKTKVVIVGHSMGSLIAIEVARRYPIVVQGLVLASPPIYRNDDERKLRLYSPDALLLSTYKSAEASIRDRPERFIALSEAATKSGVMPPTFQINHNTVLPYAKALRAAVIDQSSYRDLAKLTIPVHIVYGALDPFVVGRNFRRLAKASSNIHVHKIIALHEIRTPYIKMVAQILASIRTELTGQ